MEAIKIPSGKEFQKYPWGVTVVSLFAVVVLLLYTVLKKSDCEECEKRYEAERSKNDILTTSLLIKNGIIFKQAVEAEKKDSITTIKLNKSKEIVKEQ